ncbi:MAG: hypothetical protein IK055_06495 [Lachnospiraceae bacterium]|nr:hypothetical protein [Lachnospiraceae bacterium]
MEIYEEMKFVKMESAIHNWKEASYRVRVCMVAFLVACVIAMWLSGTRKGDLIITIICLLANGFLTYCDVRLHQFIAKGESVLYEEQMKSIDTKRRLEELGVFNYSADFNREMLLLHIPEGKTQIALAFYFVTNGIGLLFFIYALIQMF